MTDSPNVFFDLFGHILELKITSQAIVDNLTNRESCWKPLLTPSQTEDPDIIVNVVLHTPPSPLTEVQHFSNQNFFFHGSSTRLLTGYLYTNPWQVHIQSFIEDEEDTLDNMILPTLNNILFRLGMANVHCAAVSRQGRGLLLIGPSQSGKSTTSLLMAQAGFDFLSDNDVYLRQEADKVMAMSSSKELFLLDNTVDNFAALEFTKNLPIRRRGITEKRVLAMDTIMPAQCIQRTTACSVIFPQVGNNEDTEVEPIDPFECLSRLMETVPARGLPALIKDHTALNSVFDLLSALSMSTNAYRVRLGKNPEKIVSALSVLV